MRSKLIPGTYTYYLNGYDAGTEANSESADTVPGPAAGGEGNGRADPETVSAGGVTDSEGPGFSAGISTADSTAASIAAWTAVNRTPRPRVSLWTTSF